MHCKMQLWERRMISLKKRGLWLVMAAGLFFPAGATAETATPDPKSRVEVVFVLDTTGSMAGLIEGAKRKIWSIANTIVDENPDAEIRMGLIGYRDIGDKYVVRSYGLTSDIQGIYGKLLAFDADGGGDTPESVNEALDAAVLKQGWMPSAQQDRSKRIVFLVGDAPPHMDYEQDRKYPEILKDARKRGIIVNAVQAGGMRETTRVWKEIARLGDGDYMAIPQDGGRVVIIETPYDDEILQVQKELNTTVLAYGKRESKTVVRSKMDSYSAAPKSSATEMSKYVNARGKGKEVITGKGDLLADVNNGAQKLSDVPVAELPDVMQKMTPAEQSAFLAEQTRKREEYSQKLTEVLKKRDAYVQEKQTAAPGKKDSFDEAVSKTLRKQLKE